jgi:HAD superfamily hydrolase (TIGR01490 family)
VSAASEVGQTNIATQIGAATAAKVGAFFDIDGTLLPKPSLEWRFIAYLLARDEITSAQAISWFAHAAKNLWRNPRPAINANKHYLTGLHVSLAFDWADSVTSQPLEMSPQGLARISWHLAQQHCVFLVSGSLAPLARAFAATISSQIGVVATELEVTNGLWSGRLDGEHVSGKAKNTAVRALAAKHSISLDLSYAYGNTFADLPMLECVGRPCAINPSTWLKRIAAKRRWQICSWPEKSESYTNTILHAAKEAP